VSAAGAKVIIIRQRTATVRAVEILCCGDNFFQNRSVFRFIANLGRLELRLGFRGRWAASIKQHEGPNQQESTATGSQPPPRSEPPQREDAQEDE